SVIGRIHEKGERHLEGFVHLAGIDVEGDWRGDFGHHGDNAKAGSSRKMVEIAERLDMARIEADFLMRLAQGGSGSVLVMRVDLAAGKSDLARMNPQGGRPLRENDPDLVRIGGQSNEDRGGTQASGIALRPIESLRERETRPHMREDGGGSETPVSGCLGFHEFPLNSTVSIASVSSALAITKKTPADV